MNVQDITGGSTWAIAAAAFSNPMYLSGPLGKSDNSNSTGFQITPGAALVVGFEGTYAGSTVAHEQTMDPDGLTGWFSVEGSPSTGASATSTGSTSGVAYVFTCIGVLHRIKVTALSSGTIEVRIRLESEAISTSGGGGGGGGGTVDATATAVAPTYVEGTDNPLSQTLDGNLRTYDAVVAAAVAAIAAATATINVAQDTSAVFNGSTALTPKFAAISASSSGDNTIVTGVTSKKIRVLAFRVNGSAAVNWKFQSSTAGDITGLFYCVSGGQGEIGAFSPVGLFQTVAGEDLQLNLSGAVAVGGYIVYIEV